MFDVSVNDVQRLAELLTRLRNERGLTQADLAARVGVDNQTIGNIEQARPKRWRPRTARRVFESLNRAAPITDHDRDLFASLTGLVLAPPLHVPQPTPNRSIHDLLDTLVARLGLDTVKLALTAMLAMDQADPHENAHDAPDEGSVFVREPPIQRPGYVEERIREYGKASPPARPAARARAKRKSS